MVRRTTLSLLILSAAAFSAVEHQVGIPFTEHPPVLNGGGDETGWGKSAVVRRIFPKSSQEIPGQRTEFNLCYDFNYLYVRALCYENSPGYPEAYPRPWHDLLFENDDAVQVVLGVADPELAVREKIDMGGYKGAMGADVAKADMYYLYTVNAANARQRSYNEGPLEEEQFESKVWRKDGQCWCVEMRIPFDSCQLKIKPEMRIYGNLFRFRPPEMQGWYLPGFGGYVPMPFGVFEFLPPGVDGTQEDFPEPQVRKVANSELDVRVALHYGALSGTIAAEATVNPQEDMPALTGILEVDGFDRLEKEFVFKPRRGRVQALMYRDFEPREQKRRHAKFTVVDAEGTVLASAEKDCEPVEVPEWLGTDAGIEYVSQKIPAPWTQPEVNGQMVKLLDKNIKFGDNGLPADVWLRERKVHLFASVPFVRVVKAGTEVPWSLQPAKVSLDGVQARVVAEQGAERGLRLSGRTHVDFDGFMDVKLALHGADLSDVSKVQVVFPLAKGVAKYILPEETCQSAGALTGAGWRGSSHILWVGCEKAGLSFSYDENPFRGQDVRHQIELRQGADGDQLVLNLVSQEKQLSGRDVLFRFFLLPTPSKPYPATPVRGHVTWHWEGWSRFHGYPDLTKIGWIKEQLAKTREMTTLYCCQGLQEDAPEYHDYQADFEMLPRWRYYHFHNHDCFATCKRGPEGDFQLHRYRQIIKETGISGIMSDGLTVNWHDDNPLHFGCGRPYQVALDEDTSSRTILTRTFLKRMRGLFTDTGRPFCIVAHTGGGLDPVTLSFVDAYFEGEQLTRYRRGYYPSQAMFAVGYSGIPWGWRTIYWPKQLHNYNGLDTALCYSLLFNSEYYVNPNTEPANVDVELLERFAPPKGTFYPFWEPCEKLRFESDSCLASLYRREDEAMLVVSNLTYSPKGYHVNVAELFPGRSVSAEDALLHEPIALQGSEYHENLAPFSCRVFILTTRPAEARTTQPAVSEKVRPLVGFSAEDWDTLRDVRFEQGRITIQGQVQQPAQIQLKQTFGRNLELNMQVKLCERFKLTMGPCTLTIGGGWPGYGWMVTGPAHPYGRGWVFQTVPRKPDEFTDFTVSLRECVLNVRYDNKVVVKDLPFIMPAQGNRLSLFIWHTDCFVAKDLQLH